MALNLSPIDENLDLVTKKYVDDRVIDEIWIGTAAPADPNVELWYDHDDPAPSAALWVKMTQAQYDALGTKDPNTLYVIVG